MKSILLTVTFEAAESGAAFISDLCTSLFVQYLSHNDILSLHQAHKPKSCLPLGLLSGTLSRISMADISDFSLKHPLLQQGLPQFSRRPLSCPVALFHINFFYFLQDINTIWNDLFMDLRDDSVSLTRIWLLCSTCSVSINWIHTWNTSWLLHQDCQFLI